MSDRIIGEMFYPYMLLGSYEEDYLCTEDNQIFLVNKNGISRQTTIEQVEKIIFGFKQENQMYLIGEQENKESIHLLNLDTFNVEMIQELEKNEKAVAMTDRGLICVTPKEINLRDMQTGEIIQSQQWSKKINLDKNTVEVAGDYIFVYEYDDGITIREKQQLMWQ